MKHARRFLEGLFLETTDFKTVKDTAQLIALSEGDLHKESSALCECPGFDISEDDRERFCVAATLSQMTLPLQRFVNCCNQFKLGFVDIDSVFLELSNIAESLSGEEASTWLVAKCLVTAKHVRRLLCPKQTPSSFLGERSSLQTRLPVLQLFSELSLCSDVWTLVREMKWFGDEGE